MLSNIIMYIVHTFSTVVSFLGHNPVMIVAGIAGIGAAVVLGLYERK